jgi:hypothetical protein
VKEQKAHVRANAPLGQRIPEHDAFFQSVPDQLCKIRMPYDMEVTGAPPSQSSGHTGSALESQQEPHYLNPNDQTQPSGMTRSEMLFPESEWVQSSVFESFTYDQFGNWLLNEPSIAALGGA